MGIATRFVKEKGACGTGGGGGNPPTQQGLLPVESDFYDRLQLQIFYSGDVTGLPSALMSQLDSILRKYASDTIQNFPELAPEFRCVYTNEAFIGNLESFTFDTNAMTKIMDLKIIRISFRVCAVTESAAFLVYHYTFEYFSLDDNFWREDGECVQTWRFANGAWCLLGEYMDGVHMEQQGHIQR